MRIRQRHGDGAALEAYWRGIRETSPLSPEHERALFERVRAGDEDALRQVIEANLRFVVKVARDYSGYGVPLEELVAEGNMGLLEAAKRFEPERGLKFITYAVWWIRNAVHSALAQSGYAARRPVNLAPDQRKVQGVAHRLAQRLGRQPTPDEISAEVGLSTVRTRNALAAAQVDVSLDAEAGGEGLPLMQRLADGGEGADAGLHREELERLVADSLQVLDDRERRILRAHFGFDGDRPATLTEIGRALGVTRERVRQLKERALATIQAQRGHQLAEIALG